MKNQIIAVVASLLLLAGCIPGEHNSAPNEGKNLEDTRIYGNRGGDPKQLDKTYPTDPAVDERANKIKDKFYAGDEEAEETTPMNEEAPAEETETEETEEVTEENGEETEEEATEDDA
jgi:hypothetical protein